MRDVKITGGRRINVIDNSTGGGGGGGGFEMIAVIAAVVFVVAVAVAVAQAVAAALATILITLFWCAFGLLMAGVVALVSGLAYRYHKTGTLRRGGQRPGIGYSGASQAPFQAHQITDAPRRALPDRLHPDDLTAIATDLANRLRRPR